MDSKSTAAVAALSATTLFCLYQLFIYPLFLHPLNAIPGPRPSWPFALLGNVPEIVREEAAAPFARWTKQFNSGIIRYYHIFNKPRIFVSSSTALRRMFGTHAHLYGKDTRNFAMLSKFIGNGLVTIEDSLHKRQRAIINPIFRVKHINSLVPIFFQSAKELTRQWDSNLENSSTHEFELSEEMSKPTLDIIGRAGFGYDFGAVSHGQSPLFEAYSFGLSSLTLMDALINGLAPFLNWIVPSRRLKRAQFEAARVQIRAQCEQILEARKLAIKDGDETANDLLTILLKANMAEDAKNRLNDDEVMAQVMTFLAAGHETTSVALTWAIDFLANNPRVQTKLRLELRAQMPTRDTEPPLDYIMSTTSYLDAVCKESLRLVPSAVNHSLPSLWGPDAQEFKPERWITTTSDDSEGKPYGAYFPFLLGPRNCIGQRFAMLEMKAILAVLARGFEFVKVEGGGVVKKTLKLTWKPDPRLPMRIRVAE
ncbi:hypothetical protein HDU98_011261 [Podochytrium sp. JEL0797]|nr:hypothetical protein HDU98_011261 [Podochytrium sp. JEL0797]